MNTPTDTASYTPKIAAFLFIIALVFSLLFNGLNLVWFSISMGLLVILTIMLFIRLYPTGIRIGYPWLSLSVILFWLWLGIDILFSKVTYLSTINFWWVGTLPLGYLVYTLWPERDKFWNHLIKLLLLTGIILCLIALYQYFFVDGEPLATFFNRNSLAVFVNLLIFPAIVLFLTAKQRYQLIFLLVVILLFAYTIGIIKSRGAGLGFVLGFSLLLAFSYKMIGKRRWFVLFATLILAITLATVSAKLNPLTVDLSLIERVASMHDVDKAGYDRFVIWQPAWQLFLQNPLTGIGLGSYYLAIKPYLHIKDFSAQQYVHNDYLQIALETGLPGILLYLSIFVFALILFIKAIRGTKENIKLRLELLAVSSALVAVSFHSFFTFVIYTMPLTMVMGLYFARINHIAETAIPIPRRTILHLTLLRHGIYKLIISLAGFTVLFYFISLGVSTYFSNKGIELYKFVMIRDAHNAYALAQVFAPKIDTAYYLDADLLQKTAKAITDNEKVRQELLLDAERKALRAIELNPLRSYNHYVLAQIYLQLYPHDDTLALKEYRKTLELNPRLLDARHDLASLLYKKGELREAYDVIRAGFPYVYKGLTPAFLNFLALGISVSRDIDDPELADAIRERLQHYQKLYDELEETVQQ